MVTEWSQHFAMRHAPTLTNASHRAVTRIRDGYHQRTPRVAASQFGPSA